MDVTPQKPPLAGTPRSRGRRLWLQLTLLCVAYFAAARGSAAFAFASDFASPIWPPAGVALAGLLLLGPRALLAIALADFLTNLAGYADSAGGLTVLSPTLSLFLTVGSTLEAALGGWLVRRYASSGHLLNTVGDVGRFTLAASASALVSALFGTAALQFGGLVPDAGIGTVLLTWWLGDLIGMSVVTPFLISWSNLARLPRPRASELALVLLTVALAWCAFSGAFDQLAYARLWVYAAIPLLATAAFHFGPRHTTAVTLIWSGAAVWGTVGGNGPFARGPLSDSLILLDTFLALCSLTGLMLATDRHEAQHKRGERASVAGLAPSWGALLGCLALTVGAWHVIASDTERRANERFAFRLAEIKRRVEERMVAYEQVLWGCIGVLQASTRVSQMEWSAYIRAQHLSRNFPGIQGVGYAPVVSSADKLAHEARVRAEGFPEYAVYPPGSRDVYTPIVYLEPFDSNTRRAFGFDMFSEPVRRSAMELARDSGRAALSGRVKLVQERDPSTPFGFLMYVANYRDDSPGDTPEARRAQLAGYAYSRFRMSDLMRELLTDQSVFISLEIFDGREMSPATLVHASRPPDARADSTYRTPFVHTSISRPGQRLWTLRATSTPMFETLVDRQKAQIVLFAGAALSLFFFVMVRTLALTRARALELADEMTAALQDAETRFISLANAASEGIVLLDSEGAITAWNPGAAAMFEAPEEDIRGINWLTLVVERDRAGALEIWRSLLDEAEGSVSRSLSVLARTKSGREFPLEISLCSWVAKEHRRYGLIVRDVSERERAAAFFRSMFDEGPAAIVVANQQGQIVRANARASSLFGYAEQDFLAHPMDDLLPPPRAGSGRRKSMEFGGDFYARRADGSEFPVDVSVSHLKLSGGDLVIATLVDMSERKRSAEKLHATLALQTAILDGAATSIIAVDPSGLILSFNRAAERMLGYTASEMVLKQTPVILHLKDELRVRTESLNRQLGRSIDNDFAMLVANARDGRIDEQEWTFVRKDGSTLPVLLSVTALHGLDGEITGFLDVAVDISERKQREEEVHDALREKETLLKEVYHRVKNNLQVVSSLFNLQLRSLPEGPGRTSLLEGAARVRAMALVHEKLYQSANLSSIPLGAYISDLCGQLAASSAAKQRGISVALELDRVDAGPELAVPLGLLLNELFSNSLKHGFPGGRSGTIRVALRQESEQRARLEVWDDGAGFGDAATNETSSSLGLRLVRTLSRQLDGVLTLENRNGAYAAISFGLDEAHPGRKKSA